VASAGGWFDGSGGRFRPLYPYRSLIAMGRHAPTRIGHGFDDRRSCEGGPRPPRRAAGAAGHSGI